MHLNAIIKSIAGGDSSAHAYIVEGKAGKGREDFIRDLSMGLECRCADVSSRPCGNCDACRQVAAGSSMDIVRMQMSGKNGLSETVQNKLLKTLEEPRPDVILLLGTSNPDHLLSTVRSRCSTIRLQASQEAPDEDESGKTEALRTAAAMLCGEGAFCEFREAVEKCVKTRGDALMLIDEAEEEFRTRMKSGDMPAAMADRLELCEKARADIERDMDRNKALKRLRLELTGH